MNNCVVYHRIHRRQHAFTDDAGMSKHRLSPHNAYYHNSQTLNFTATLQVDIERPRRERLDSASNHGRGLFSWITKPLTRYNALVLRVS